MTDSATASRYDADLVYRRIGEFAVCFQWLEHQFREIGWLLLDPCRQTWPPTDLRDLTNHNLLNRVRQIYLQVVSTLNGAGVQGYCDSFSYVVDRAHEARRFRNDLLHSAYVELKAGGDVQEIMQANPRAIVGAGGVLEVTTNLLSAQDLSARLASLGSLSVGVDMHHRQLIHWSPFINVSPIVECGLPFHVTGLPVEGSR